MSAEGPIAVLGSRLCPWLGEPLARLEAARRNERLGHAWLIGGPADVGKLNLALVFAHRLLGAGRADPPPLEPAEANAAMRECRTPSDHHPDLHLVFPLEDKRSIGIEQVRDVAEALTMKAFRGAAKVAIFDPAEAMTAAAANALLKTLEEPTASTYLLLVSHRPDRLLPTIRSRCQSIAVAPPSLPAAAAWLGVDAEAGTSVLLAAGRSPLRAARLLEADKGRLLDGLERKLEKISRSKLDPRAVAEECLREDPELALEWLARRIERAIRERAAPGRDSKAVTPGGDDPLHNAWRSLPTRALFERREAAEKLLDQLGSGINIELALHSLLASFEVA